MRIFGETANAKSLGNNIFDGPAKRPGWPKPNDWRKE